MPPPQCGGRTDTSWKLTAEEAAQMVVEDKYEEEECSEDGEGIARSSEEKDEQDLEEPSALESKPNNGKLVSNFIQVKPLPPPTSQRHDSLSVKRQRL